MIDEWWTISEVPIYEINADGQVRNKNSGHILKEYRMRLTGARMVDLFGPDRRTLSRSVGKLLRLYRPDKVEV